MYLVSYIAVMIILTSYLMHFSCHKKTATRQTASVAAVSAQFSRYSLYSLLTVRSIYEPSGVPFLDFGGLLNYQTKAIRLKWRFFSAQ